MHTQGTGSRLGESQPAPASGSVLGFLVAPRSEEPSSRTGVTTDSAVWPETLSLVNPSLNKLCLWASVTVMGK